MTEQEILQDLLIAHKFLMSMYNQFGMECSNKPLRNLFLKHQAEVSEHNFNIFELMKKQGYYPVTEAASKEVNKAIKMHSQMQTDLDAKV